MKDKHYLRSIVHKDTVISDAELQEIDEQDGFREFFDNEVYEFNGNYILTDSEAVLDEAVYQMCCGIVAQRYVLKSGREVFFAFDYGH